MSVEKNIPLINDVFKSHLNFEIKKQLMFFEVKYFQI